MMDLIEIQKCFEITKVSNIYIYNKEICMRVRFLINICVNS